MTITHDPTSILPTHDERGIETDHMTHPDYDESRRIGQLNDMAQRIWVVNDANGWYEDKRTFAEDVALVHSEVSEMLEAYREGGLADMTEFEQAKPEGVGSEMADVLIRLLDMAFRYNCDLEFEVERKLAFNRTRGYKHGGKRI